MMWNFWHITPIILILIYCTSSFAKFCQFASWRKKLIWPPLSDLGMLLFFCREVLSLFELLSVQLPLSQVRRDTHSCTDLLRERWSNGEKGEGIYSCAREAGCVYKERIFSPFSFDELTGASPPTWSMDKTARR